MINNLPEGPIRGLSNENGTWILTTTAVYYLGQPHGFELRYRHNESQAEASFADISSAREIWIAGSMLRNGIKEGCIIKGESGGVEWAEVPLASAPRGSFVKTIAVYRDGCWLLLNPTGYSAEKSGILYRYSDSGLKSYPFIGNVSITKPPDPGNNILFAVGSGDGPIFPVHITTDDGASWVYEEIPAGLIQGRVMKSARAAAAVGDNLYIISECEWPGPTAIIRRYGQPGEGTYIPVFMAYEGPYFYRLDEFAARIPLNYPYGISTDAVGVGPRTSLVLDEGETRLEELPYAVEFKYLTPIYGESGFWAIGESTLPGAGGLYYHP